MCNKIKSQARKKPFKKVNYLYFPFFHLHVYIKYINMLSSYIVHMCWYKINACGRQDNIIGEKCNKNITSGPCARRKLPLANTIFMCVDGYEEAKWWWWECEGATPLYNNAANIWVRIVNVCIQQIYIWSIT